MKRFLFFLLCPWDGTPALSFFSDAIFSTDTHKQSKGMLLPDMGDRGQLSSFWAQKGTNRRVCWGEFCKRKPWTLAVSKKILIYITLHPWTEERIVIFFFFNEEDMERSIIYHVLKKVGKWYVQSYNYVKLYVSMNIHMYVNPSAL